MGGWNDTSHTRGAIATDAVICLLVALALRFATFGDPNLHMDEAFYFYVGLEMHEGAIPYVDIWDRKPLGLFALYWLFAGFSESVLAYQIPAWLFAGYTAWVVSRIVALFGSRLAGLLAACCYLALLLPLNGHGGQSPIFYNALIASAVWLVLLADDRLKRGVVPKTAWAAMALCGLALTIKQTTLFESVFLGLWIVWRLWRSGMQPARLLTYGAGFAVLGALPFVSIGLWYWANGYWDRYWFAMVTANIARPPVEAAPSHNIPVLLHALALLLVGALSALVLAKRYEGFLQYRLFMISWMVAAFVGFLSVPLFIDHYALPLLVPLCVVAAAHFGKSLAGTILGATITIAAIVLTNPFDKAAHERSTKMFAELSDAVAASPGDGFLFIYDGPMLLYVQPEVSPMTELAFPWHLVSISERGTAFIDQRSELERVLDVGPSLVVATDEWKSEPYPGALAQVQRYISENCELLYTGMRSQKRHPSRPVYLYGHCNEAR